MHVFIVGWSLFELLEPRRHLPCIFHLGCLMILCVVRMRRRRRWVGGGGWLFDKMYKHTCLTCARIKCLMAHDSHFPRIASNHLRQARRTGGDVALATGSRLFGAVKRRRVRSGSSDRRCPPRQSGASAVRIPTNGD